MKRIDMFCASQASTAICLSMDQASCSSSNTIQLGGRAIDRHNPIINDSRRSTSRAPCSSSQPPINPKSYQKSKIKNSSSNPNGQNKKNAAKVHDQKKKSTAEKLTDNVTNNTKSHSSKPIDSTLRRTWLKAPNESVTSLGSTRSLLSNTALLDGSSDYEPVLALNKGDTKKAQVVCEDEIHPASKSSSSSRPKSGSQTRLSSVLLTINLPAVRYLSGTKVDQSDVVVLRVSLHCKGCVGKVRKHLSRMQGVSSFNIDFAAKKVTVIGDVTPLSVLASISKVKSAQFWPTSASALGSGCAETKIQSSCG